MDKKILGCPFCGSEPRVYMKIYLHEYPMPVFCVECFECGKAKVDEGWFIIDECIKEWNLRSKKDYACEHEYALNYKLCEHGKPERFGCLICEKLDKDKNAWEN